MHTTIGIAVEAPARRVFDLARDLERWPRMLPHYRSVTVRSRQGERIEARMVAVRRFGPLPFPVTWRAEQWADASDPDDLRLEFRHVWGVTRGMRVTWHIRPSASGCDVTIEHEFSRGIPLVGKRLLPAFVDRVFTRPIAGRTLATFKRLAESGAGPGAKGKA
jgi:ribosome-associated toxin RatA of RatAB toxin-antitoxin module